MADDLHRPLGVGSVRRRGRGTTLALVCAAGLVAAGAAGLTWWRHGADPTVPGGAVVAAIKPAPAPPPTPAVPSVPKQPEPTVASDAGEVLRPAGQPPGTGVFIKVPQEPTVALAPAPDPRLVEKSRSGPLPRLGQDGARPMDVYARPPTLEPSLPANAPRLALIVSGLGSDPALAAQATAALPPGITFGFTPTGDKVERRVRDARDAGHEVVLVLATGSPSDGPGAHGLTTDLGAADVLDRLHWQMSRFTGYVGATAAADTPFMTSEAGVRPMLADLAGRGLLFVDAGASNRSAAPSVAANLDLPLIRAALPSGGAPDTGIDAALAAFEQRARERGSAVGLITASAASLIPIAQFAGKLAERGVALVPVSAVAALQAGPSGKAARQ